MRTILPKGKKILTVIGIIAVIILGWLFFPQIQLRTGSTPAEEFNERPHTEFIDFIASLPQETSHYIISFDDYYNHVVIKPLVSIDDSKDVTVELERVWPTYEKYTQEALTWMRDQKADFASFDIYFFNQDFWPTGRIISL